MNQATAQEIAALEKEAKDHALGLRIISKREELHGPLSQNLVEQRSAMADALITVTSRIAYLKEAADL